MKNYLADIEVGDLRGPGGIGDPGANAPQLLDQIISTIVGTMTAVAFIWFTIQFFIGAISWITAGGDKGKVEGARTKLTHSLIGLVITISAIFLIDLVGRILGIEILDIPALITDLTTTG